jgi:hypothetical protein
MLVREIIEVNSENHKKHINTLCEEGAKFISVKACGMNSYHYALKGCPCA